MITFERTRRGGGVSYRATADNGVAVGYARATNRPSGFTWWACSCSADGTYGHAANPELAQAAALAAAATHRVHVAV